MPPRKKVEDPPKNFFITLDRGSMAVTGYTRIEGGCLYVDPTDSPEFVLSPVAWRQLQEMP